MAGAKLSDEQQILVVQSLACFEKPGDISKMLKDEYDVAISPQGIEKYDPHKWAGRNIPEKWKELHAETRAAFLADTASIGISHRVVRLRALERMAIKAEGQGNMVLASSLMEQAAKEVGDAYTNRREVTGAGGKDLPTSQVTIFSLPDNGR